VTESAPPLPDDPEQLRDLLRELGAKHPEEARKVAEKLRLAEEPAGESGE
jgi:hypothetical protein